MLALGMALPSLTSTSSSEVRAAARTLAAGLRGARVQAISGNQAVALSIDVDARNMVIAGAANLRQPAKKLPDDLDYKLFTARSEVVRPNLGRIRFFADGSSTGGRVTVSSDRSAILVDVDWLTGRIQVIEGDRDELLRSAERPVGART
jgi:general secretion pathway protein H